MSREQLLELEDMKRGLLVQAYRMKQECPKVCRSIAEQKSKYCMNDTKEGSVNGMRYVG